MSSHNKATITGLYRHAVKGLSADSLESVTIQKAFDTFPDDRRFALLYDKNKEQWEEQEEDAPEWLHKQNFLCAFTNPKLMAQYQVSYQIVKASVGGGDDKNDDLTRRLLELKDRSSQEIVWGPEDLATEEGRASLGDFFSQQSVLSSVTCITADSKQHQQKFQFGNTSSGWKQRKDTRTIHLVNANTVRNVEDVCQVSLNPTRFRPNIIVEGWEPWVEFEWIGKRLKIETDAGTTMKLSILSKTVRCEGVGIDPLDPDNILDIPKLLSKNFPEHGPYLGVYAVIEDPGDISLGDKVSLVVDDDE